MAFPTFAALRRCLFTLSVVVHRLTASAAGIGVVAVGLAGLPQPAAGQGCNPYPVNPSCPWNQPPQIVISPTSNVNNASSIVVTITVSDDHTMSNYPQFSHTLTGISDNWTGLSTSATITGTLALANGTTNFKVTVMDDNNVTRVDSVIYTYTQPVTPVAQAAPALDLWLAHSSTIRSVGGCAGCLYGGASYSTPAYISRDLPRAVSLIYSSGQAVPRGLFQADATINTTTTPTGVRVQLRQGGSAVSLTNGGTSAWYTGLAGRMRVAAQFDASGLATGAHNYTAAVAADWSGTSYETTANVRVLVVNEASSVFGAGWSIAGLQHLFTSTDSATITDGRGGITFYRRTSSTGFATELGAIDALTVNGSGIYTLTASDGSWSRFSSSGLMTATGNRFNDSTTYAYDGSSRISTITDEAGKATTFTYAPDGVCPSGATSGKLCAITTPGGRVSKFVVNASGDLVTIIDPDGVTAFSGSYSGHKLTSAVDRLGAATSLTYDSFTGLDTVKAPSVTTTTIGGSTTTESPVTTYQSIEAALLSISNTSSGSARAYVRWDTAYAKTIGPNGTVVAMWLQAGEPVVTRVIPLAGPSQTTTVMYNDNYLPASVTQSPLGGTTRYDWRGRDTLWQVVDPTGKRTRIYTTSYLRPDSIKVNDTTVQRTTYQSSSATTTGHTSRKVDWDSHGRITKDSVPGSVTVMSYDASGFQNTHDVKIGKTSVIQLGTVATYTYDGFGRDSVVTSLSYPTTTTYDLLNRVTSSTQIGTNSVTATTSMAVSENTSAHTATVTVTDPRSLTFSGVSNALGWGTSTTDPHSNATAAGYDRNGLLRRAVNRVSGAVTASYDSLGRPVSIIANGNTTSFGYDPATSPTEVHAIYGQNTEGRDSTTMDALGRPMTTTVTRGGQTFSLVNTYDVKGDRNKLRITTSGSVDSLVFATDKRHYPLQMPDFSQNWTNVQYSDGKVQQITWTLGHQLLWRGYNRFARAETVFVNVGGILTERHYSYDLLGRLVSPEKSLDYSHEFYFHEYGYNGQGRLAKDYYLRYWVSDSVQDDCPDPEEWCDPDRPWGYVWSLDTLKKMVYATDLSGNRTDGSASFSNDRLSSMTGTNGVSYSFTYDAEGRRTAKTASGYSQTYGWNDLGQLIWVVTNGDSVAYGYDAFGRRIRKYVSGATTQYLWDGDNLVMELDGSGAPVKKYSYQPGIDRPLTVSTSTDTYFYHVDELGNVVGLYDAAGSQVADYEYEAYGYLLASSGTLTQPLRWKGREFDSETGLYFMRARYYDPVVGRFISEDPIGLAGGINPYIYADGEPVNQSDPWGLETQCSSGWAKDKDGKCTIPVLGQVVTTAQATPDWWPSSAPTSSGIDRTIGIRLASPGPGGGGGSRRSGSARSGSTAGPACAAAPSIVGAAAGSSALDWYRSIWDDASASVTAKAGALLGGLFAALWTEDTANRTTGVLLAGYAARATGPDQYLGREGVPGSIRQGRQTFRWDSPHHGKGWHIDGTITGKGPRGTQTFVDVIGCG